MKWFIIPLLLFSMTTYAEEYMQFTVDVGKDFQPPWHKGDGWEGELPIEFTIAYYYVSKQNWIFTAGYSHQSNVLTGLPFNNEPEDVLDKVYIGFGKRFNLGG